MPTLEQITQTGTISIDRNRNLHPEIASLAEQLVAEEFAEAINSGRLCVRDAYANFWSYAEDDELWELEGLDKDEKRSILPRWSPIILRTMSMVDQREIETLREIATRGYFKIGENIPYKEMSGKGIYWGYNPFTLNLMLCKFISQGFGREVWKIIAQLPSGIMSKYQSLVLGGAAMSDQRKTDIMERKTTGEQKEGLTDFEYLERVSNSLDPVNMPQLLRYVEGDWHEDIRYKATELLSREGGREELAVIRRSLFRKNSFYDPRLDRKIEELGLNENFAFWHRMLYFRRAYGALMNLHHQLKPKGYNPPEKRLAA